MNGSETGKGKIKGGRGKEKVGVGLKKKEKEEIMQNLWGFPINQRFGSGSVSGKVYMDPGSAKN